MKFALHFVEDVDRASLGFGELHRFGNDGRQHGFEVERGIDRLAYLFECPQLTDGVRQLGDVAP